MSIFNPKMNPVRFYNKANAPNYITEFLNAYNWRQRVNYTPGIYPVLFYKDFVINREIAFQFQIFGTIDEDVTIYKFNDDTQIWDINGTITPTDITPTGWLSTTVNKYTHTPTVSGVYYYDFAEANYRSDEFIVHDSEKFLKRLVEIKYYNSTNDYGMVFVDNTLLYEATTFFTGLLIPGSTNEISGFEPDRGGFRKTRSTPMDTATLMITDTHISYAPLINLIFSCDNLYINGIQYENEDAVDKEDLEKVDVSNFTINLVQANTDYNTP